MTTISDADLWEHIKNCCSEEIPEVFQTHGNVGRIIFIVTIYLAQWSTRIIVKISLRHTDYIVYNRLEMG